MINIFNQYCASVGVNPDMFWECVPLEDAGMVRQEIIKASDENEWLKIINKYC